MRELKFGRQGAAPGQAKHLVVLLHGYGADGDDLLGLSGPMGPHLPGTAFIAPDAPNPCSGNPFGREWFPIPWLDGSSEEAARKGMEESIADLNAFLDARMKEEGLRALDTLLDGLPVCWDAPLGTLYFIGPADPALCPHRVKGP